MAPSPPRAAPRRPRRAPDLTSLRQQVGALQRALYRHNQRRIDAQVSGTTAEFRAYARTYRRQVGRGTGRVAAAAVDAAVAAADVVFVGDYHTLARAQRAFVRLLRRLPPGRGVTVALELVPSRSQTLLRRLQAGELDAAAFWRRLAAAGQRPEASSRRAYEALFALAQRRRWTLVGIDSRGGGGHGALRARDAHAAGRIAAAWRARPDDRVVVLAGELHVAPGHLPRAVRVACAGRRRGAPRAVVVYQNSEPVHARLQAAGQAPRGGAVQVAPAAFCLTHTHPVLCQQSFLLWLEGDDVDRVEDDLPRTFRAVARRLAQLFALPAAAAAAAERATVTTAADLSFLPRLQRRRTLTPAQVRRLRAQVLGAESATLPDAALVHLGSPSPAHVAEEATHLLRHACGPWQQPRRQVDAFYSRVIEEALGFVGSRLVDPRRPWPTRRTLRAQMGPRADATARGIAGAALAHARLERGAAAGCLASVYGCGPALFDGVTHVVGYRLGARLHAALMAGQLPPATVRALFFCDLAADGAALTAYLVLLHRCRRAAAAAAVGHIFDPVADSSRSSGQRAPPAGAR